MASANCVNATRVLSTYRAEENTTIIYTTYCATYVPLPLRPYTVYKNIHANAADAIATTGANNYMTNIRARAPPPHTWAPAAHVGPRRPSDARVPMDTP